MMAAPMSPEDLADWYGRQAAFVPPLSADAGMIEAPLFGFGRLLPTDRAAMAHILGINLAGMPSALAVESARLLAPPRQVDSRARVRWGREPWHWMTVNPASTQPGRLLAEAQRASRYFVAAHDRAIIQRADTRRLRSWQAARRSLSRRLPPWRGLDSSRCSISLDFLADSAKASAGRFDGLKEALDKQAASEGWLVRRWNFLRETVADLAEALVEVLVLSVALVVGVFSHKAGWAMSARTARWSEAAGVAVWDAADWVEDALGRVGACLRELRQAPGELAVDMRDDVRSGVRRFWR